MAALSQEASTPFKDSVAGYIRSYWKKIIEEEDNKTIAAYTELIRQHEKNMASISAQISIEVSDATLASQIIDEEIPSIQDFVRAIADKIEQFGGPAEPLPTDIPQPTGKANQETSPVRGLDAPLDAAPRNFKEQHPTKPRDPNGKRASTQMPLDSPKMTKEPRATRASTQKLPDSSAKRLSINGLTAFTNPVVPSSTPSTTKLPTTRQPIKRRRTEPNDSFPRPPSKLKVSPPTLHPPPHNPSTTMDTNPPPPTSPPCQTRPPPPPPTKAPCTGPTSRTAPSYSSTPTASTTPVYATASTAVGGTGSARTRSRRRRPSGTFNHRT